ncbi:uncharacterized protein LOC126835645 isoform X2 [Adelges cooleyi]|uniref:uncharacterized protein LOC126835645 isoform X2 n=1 Tax=Adelges cooleyi TaxID=133065 RepID=UPI00217FEF6B|nr:uncharacterized protein LOC126835645 isoform X2 [Adelges cooleyi]
MVSFLNYLLICFLVKEKVSGNSIVFGANDISKPEKTNWNNGNVENITPRDLFTSPIELSLLESYLSNRKAYNQKSNLRPIPIRQQQNKKQNRPKLKVNYTPNPKVNPTINSKINPTKNSKISPPIDSKINPPTDPNSNASVQSTNKGDVLKKTKSAEALDEGFVKQVRKWALLKLSKIRSSYQKSEAFKEDTNLNMYSQLRADAISKGNLVDKSNHNEMKFTKRGTKSFKKPMVLANDIISVWQVKYPKIIYSKDYKRYKFGLGVAKSSNGKFYAVSNLT